MNKTLIGSILKGKCPVCRTGNAFEDPNMYRFKTIDKMPKTCSHCGHKFEKEPGFWFGAMFVSYALTVAVGVFSFVLLFLIYPKANVWHYIIFISFVAIFVAPLNFRTSRMLWMNFFSKYDKNRAKNSKR
ncbi:MAG: DUF983 domain-containing protein [Bacteroidota bacterium]